MPGSPGPICPQFGLHGDPVRRSGRLATQTGCVQRRLTIRSSPPGAVVYVGNQEIGTTPISHDFIYYGSREPQAGQRWLSKRSRPCADSASLVGPAGHRLCQRESDPQRNPRSPGARLPDPAASDRADRTTHRPGRRIAPHWPGNCKPPRRRVARDPLGAAERGARLPPGALPPAHCLRARCLPAAAPPGTSFPV